MPKRLAVNQGDGTIEDSWPILEYDSPIWDPNGKTSGITSYVQDIDFFWIIGLVSFPLYAGLLEDFFKDL